MDVSKKVRQKSEQENQYTSTGVKFWRHPNALNAYKAHDSHTIISTHISPESACNLSCPYCSVSKRKTGERIELDVIKKYVETLQGKGLQAVILTGGGEPTLYPHFNDLVRWLKLERRLSVALITNGTMNECVESDVWNMFSWVRVSLNFFDGYRQKIGFPKTNGILGASMVYVGQPLEEFKEIAKFVDDAVRYVRVLPNCLLPQDELIEEHRKIEAILSEMGDKRFFQQFKIHGRPCSSVCHQAYFRPYLSEVGKGTVFPCDSLVLNDEQKHFHDKYAICKAEEIADFLEGKIKMRFDPSISCEGCVFTDNIKLLDDWCRSGANRFEEYKEKIEHEEFV